MRLHKFGELDEDVKRGTPTFKMPSYIAMQELAVNDAQVKKQLVTERIEGAKEDLKFRASLDFFQINHDQTQKL